MIEYVINTFIKKPHSLHSSANIRLDTESFDDVKLFSKHVVSNAANDDVNETEDVKKERGNCDPSNTSKER